MKWEDLEPFAGDSKSILWGGIPGSYFTDCVDDEEFDRHVKHLLSIMVESHVLFWVLPTRCLRMDLKDG